MKGLSALKGDQDNPVSVQEPNVPTRSADSNDSWNRRKCKVVTTSVYNLCIPL